MYTATKITHTDQIEEELLDIQAFLELPYASDNPAACLDRLNTLSQHIARSGKIKADAEWHYHNVVSSEIMNALRDALTDKMTPSTLNKFIDAKAKDFKHLVTFADRVNRSSTHSAENLRTIISFLKSQMQL